MSDLTNALDIIFNWLQQNQWSRFKETENSASLIKPGLTRAEIDAMIGDSNRQLPQEVYELYQWRNGDQIGEWEYVGLFDICHNFSGFAPWGFVPLQSIVTGYMQAQNSPRRFARYGLLLQR